MRIRILLAAVLALSLSACKKSFIELAPKTAVTEATYFKTADDYTQAVVGAYVPLRSIYSDAYVMGEMRSDNATYFASPGLQGGQFSDKWNISGFLDITINMNGMNKYASCYVGIARTNAILDRIDNSTIDAAVKANLKGQAQFLRSFYYFELVQYFGGVPLHLKEVTSVAEASLPRSSVNDVYKQIIADATSAAGLLPAKQTTVGMVTKGSAKTLLGYVYMTLKQYPAAETSLTDVTSLGYSLLPDYASVFASRNTAESIFEVQYLEGPQGQQSNFAFQFAPNISNVKNILGVSGDNKTTGGWNKPTPDLIAAYEAGDTRKNASIAFSYVDGDGNTVNDTYCKKYTHGPYATFNNTGDDWIVYRYADVLLLLAECLNEEGKSAQAIPYLNQVRVRAGLAVTTAASQVGLRAAIAKERRVELAFENHRWLDLVRTGQAINTMTAFGVKIKQAQPYLPSSAYLNITQNRLIFPIPQSEIDINSKLTQNPGY
ncbi:RagB/SusD family nutrient uptake outer membrane protein [Mucilaginibacter flavus]|uniref:RagB/SusD family nutrient uptake outer membrane protein n=1 Tax=Mucilaginibacter flavus TaxID=931504 RepID=UPI0025B577BD|nr:RagB/SusD family nutrient uptake outer membrane protein [Mucilaginibacter flavus]MDN3581414.1 RagB/SusD family nutrient uptake outer membrane protein [Mucilaginibacter flavus]